MSCSQRLLETRCVPQRQINPETEEEILDIVANDPSTSTRRIARQVGVSHFVVHRTLKEQLLYPYHVQRVQALTPTDFAPRQNFCEWFLQKINGDANFLSRILATNEATFPRDGIVNFYNLHSYAEENPHQIVQSKFQHRFSVNVWGGIIGNTVIFAFIRGNLTGERYLEFKTNPNWLITFH